MMEPMIICFLSLMVGLSAAFTITLMRKWGIIEWVQVHGNRFFSEMFRCDLCLSFWTSLLMSLPLLLGTLHVCYLIVPVMGAMISRKML